MKKGSFNKKKGSMELSVNSIVILVIAVVLLGLILAFVKTQFSKMDKSFGADEPNPQSAESGNQITLSRESIQASAGDNFPLKVNVYNDGELNITNANLLLNCTDNTLVTSQVNTQTIQPGEQKMFTIAVSLKKAAPKKLNLCKISVVAGATPGTTIYQKDFSINVQ